MSTRAIHLELTEGLTVTSFLQACRRFTSCRGLLSRLLTDNAKTFNPSSVEVKKIVRSSKVTSTWRTSKLNGNSFWREPHGKVASGKERKGV